MTTVTPGPLAEARVEYVGALRRLESDVTTAHRLAERLGRELAPEHLGSLACMGRLIEDLIPDAEGE